MTETQLLKRCCESPEDHLAEATISHFGAYSFGYVLNGMEAEDFDRDAFTSAVKADYNLQGEWPFNVSAQGFLVAAEGEVRALRKLLEYHLRLATPSGKPHPAYKVTLFDLLAAGGGIREKTPLYLGNDADISHIWSLLSGARWAEIDTTGGPGKAALFLTQFQDWIEQRFLFSKGIPWPRTLYFVSLGDSRRSLSTFFQLFDSFQMGESPDCLSQTAQLIKQSMTRDGDGFSESENLARHIAPI